MSDYHVVALDSIPPHPAQESDRRTIQDEVDLDHVGLSVYTAAPGEQIPQAYHYHDTQEELLYVVGGELHVEKPDREYVVGENGVFVAEPQSPHRAINPETATGRCESSRSAGQSSRTGTDTTTRQKWNTTEQTGGVGAGP